MTDQEYQDWAAQHAATFGLNLENAARTLAAWQAVFNLAGYHADELHEATRSIAAFSELRFLNEHLPAIRKAVMNQRLQKARENALAARTAEECNLCQDTGWVLVPMLRSVVDGEWGCLTGRTLPTAVVTCKCMRGCRIWNIWQSGERNKFKPMALADYETSVPHWFELLTKRQELDAAEALANAFATEAQGTAFRFTQAVAEAMKP